MSRMGWSENLQLHWQRSPLALRWQALPARDRLALLALSLFLLLVLFYLAPVSYTHLDVYKRQPWVSTLKPWVAITERNS